MASEQPFYMWDIAEAWEWLSRVPILGFALLVAVGLFLAFLVFALCFRIYVREELRRERERLVREGHSIDHLAHLD